MLDDALIYKIHGGVTPIAVYGSLIAWYQPLNRVTPLSSSRVSDQVETTAHQVRVDCSDAVRDNIVRTLAVAST